MDPEEAPYYSRTAAFGQGRYGSAGLTPSLQQASMRQNSASPKAFQPTSVLQQFIASPNGMSARDSDRRVLGGGLLPSGNGMSEQTNTASRPLVNKYANV